MHALQSIDTDVCIRTQEAHVAKLSGNLDSSGDASLQNGLDTSVNALKAIPPYGHREASAVFQTQTNGFCRSGRFSRDSWQQLWY